MFVCGMVARAEDIDQLVCWGLGLEGSPAIFGGIVGVTIFGGIIGAAWGRSAGVGDCLIKSHS